ncbi:unannotated protein [freshwater metagenome]|uniref:Unannotated protein n=1 Tax=freshwater metagenome TaxID=449393 RepID=A0A6J6G3F2_9ZZZZ
MAFSKLSRLGISPASRVTFTASSAAIAWTPASVVLPASRVRAWVTEPSMR